MQNTSEGSAAHEDVKMPPGVMPCVCLWMCLAISRQKQVVEEKKEQSVNVQQKLIQTIISDARQESETTVFYFIIPNFNVFSNKSLQNKAVIFFYLLFFCYLHKACVKVP